MTYNNRSFVLVFVLIFSTISLWRENAHAHAQLAPAGRGRMSHGDQRQQLWFRISLSLLILLVRQAERSIVDLDGATESFRRVLVDPSSRAGPRGDR